MFRECRVAVDEMQIKDCRAKFHIPNVRDAERELDGPASIIRCLKLALINL